MSNTYEWTTNGLHLDAMLEQSRTREGGIYKWALVDNQFRFVRVHWHENHGMLVNDGEQATDAGTISTAEDYLRITGRGSDTLKVGCSAEAEEALLQLFAKAGRPFRDKYGW